MADLYTPTRDDLDIFADHGIDNYLNELNELILSETGITDDDLDEYEIVPVPNEEKIIDDVQRLALEENVFLDLTASWYHIKPFFKESWIDFDVWLPGQKKPTSVSSACEIVQLIQENPLKKSA